MIKLMIRSCRASSGAVQRAPDRFLFVSQSRANILWVRRPVKKMTISQVESTEYCQRLTVFSFDRQITGSHCIRRM